MVRFRQKMKNIVRSKCRQNSTRKSHQVWIHYFYPLNHTGVICSGAGHIEPPSGGRVKPNNHYTEYCFNYKSVRLDWWDSMNCDLLSWIWHTNMFFSDLGWNLFEFPKGPVNIYQETELVLDFYSNWYSIRNSFKAALTVWGKIRLKKKRNILGIFYEFWPIWPSLTSNLLFPLKWETTHFFIGNSIFNLSLGVA